jgi:hypothetical protein
LALASASAGNKICFTCVATPVWSNKNNNYRHEEGNREGEEEKIY